MDEKFDFNEAVKELLAGKKSYGLSLNKMNVLISTGGGVYDIS
jgi:hypothetical protein